MHKTTRIVAWCAALLFAGTSVAQAQMLPMGGQGIRHLQLGLQAGSQDFDETATPVIYGENALITVPHSVDGGVLIDFSGGARVWRNLGIGLGYSRTSSTRGADARRPDSEPRHLQQPARGERQHGRPRAHRIGHPSAVPLDAADHQRVRDRRHLRAVLLQHHAGPGGQRRHHRRPARRLAPSPSRRWKSSGSPSARTGFTLRRGRHLSADARTTASADSCASLAPTPTWKRPAAAR